MRLIAKFDSFEEGQEFFSFLRIKGINCKFDSDDGNSVWVNNEDDVKAAKELYDDYKNNKLQDTAEWKDAKQKFDKQNEIDDKAKRVDEEEDAQDEYEGLKEGKPNATAGVEAITLQNRYSGFYTKLIALACTVIFIISIYQYNAMLIETEIGHSRPVLTDIQSKLLYDYSPAMQKALEFNAKYVIEGKIPHDNLSPDAEALLQSVEKNPPWIGLYGILTNWENRDTYEKSTLFYSIRRWQVWRLVTPIMLHGDILHLLFNMLWLWFLGRMLEYNMGIIKYTCFIVVIAAITNTLQYLMTGPFFMGFSGVVAAMIGYIWIRKKRAPWELYPIEKWTLAIVTIFIFGLFAVQLVSFILHILNIYSFHIGIANTAHVSGIFLGALIGRLK